MSTDPLKLRLRSNLLALVLLLSGLALAASWRPEAEPEFDGKIPRVTVGGIGLGDSLGDLVGQWGSLEQESSGLGGDFRFWPVSAKRPSVPMLSQFAECGPLAGVESVSADSLEIEGQRVLRKGDPIELVEKRLGPSTPGLDRRERCGNGLFLAWEYRTGGQRYTVYAINPERVTLPKGVDPASVPELNTIQGFVLNPAETQNDGSWLGLF